MLINSNRDASQQTLGWVQLATDHTKGLAAPYPTIRVIDWAYSDTPGELISMGQRPTSVPEAGSFAAGLVVDRNLLVGKKALPFPKDKLFLTIVPGRDHGFCSLDYLIKLLFAPQP